MNDNEQATQRAAEPKKKEDNEAYFINRLKHQGFDNHLSQPLRDKLKEGRDEFKLKFEGQSIGHFGKMRTIDFELNFKKDKVKKDDKGQPLYYFNSMKATLLDGQDPTKNRSHLFYMQNDRGVTTKDAFNLLEGRAVKKTVTVNKKDEQGNFVYTPGVRPETKQVWLQLDLGKRRNENEFEMNSYYEQYKYDLNKAVGRFEIKGIEYEGTKVKILESLEKGNLTPVVFVGAENTNGFLAANPKDWNVLAYDSKWEAFGHGMRQHTGERKGNGQDGNTSESQDQSRPNTNSTALRTDSSSDKDLANGKANVNAQSALSTDRTTVQTSKQQTENVGTRKSQEHETAKRRSRGIGA